MKRTRLLALALGLGLMGSAASATTLDFVDFANSPPPGGEQSINSGDTLTFDGVDVTFTSNYNPYFDANSGGPGGLGVCKTESCAGSSDDNITNGEWVTLTFDTEVILSDFSFTNNDHQDLNSSSKTLMVGYDGAAPTAVSFADMVGTTTGPVTSITFQWGGSSRSSDFYVNGFTVSPVPLPAAGLLLLGGIAGLAGLKRRRRAA